MKYLLILLTLLVNSQVFAQINFDAKSPTTDKFDKLCYPVKAGNSITIPITVKCNITKKFQPYKVSIDMYQSFSMYNGWVTIENNSQNMDSSQTITFNLTITPPSTPTITPSGQYTFDLFFTVQNKNNEILNPTITKPEFIVIVDNIPPSKPIISVQTKKSNYLSIEGCSSVDLDHLSSSYCLANDTAGILGIQDLFILLKNTSTNTIVKKKDKYENTRDWYEFSEITPNTTYEATVAVSDLAGNMNTSNMLMVTTPPAPPASCAYTSSYCSTTLTWPPSANATGYYLYDASRNLIFQNLITSNSVTVNNLIAGTAYKYYVASYSNAGGVSEFSQLFSSTTLSVPQPIISGPSTICSNIATFTATNLPSDCSVQWDQKANLNLISSMGNSVSYSTIGTGSAWITAKFISCGGSNTSPQRPVLISAPPTQPVINIPSEPVNCQYNAVVWAAATPNDVSYSWSVINGTIVSQDDEELLLKPNCPPAGWKKPWTMTLQLQTTNNCGIANAVSRTLTVTNGGGVNPTFFISPNPASSTITISQTSDTRSYSDSEMENKRIKSVRITDKFGRNVSIQRYGDETVEAVLNISNIPVGIYFITINPGPDQETLSFIKK